MPGGSRGWYLGEGGAIMLDRYSLCCALLSCSCSQAEVIPNSLGHTLRGLAAQAVEVIIQQTMSNRKEGIFYNLL